MSFLILILRNFNFVQLGQTRLFSPRFMVWLANAPQDYQLLHCALSLSALFFWLVCEICTRNIVGSHLDCSHEFYLLKLYFTWTVLLWLDDVITTCIESVGFSQSYLSIFRIREFSEWAQCLVLELVAKYVLMYHVIAMKYLTLWIFLRIGFSMLTVQLCWQPSSCLCS